MPDDLHEWLSFEDPDDDRTWVFDITFLTSPWTCIYGRGCQGVLTGPTPELHQGCCSYGAHFVDDEDLAATAVYVGRLTDANWQFRRKGLRGGWHNEDDEGVTISRLVDDACIFLNRPGFAGGAGCALHAAALQAGERPLDWKPNVCWQLPLRLHEDIDDHGHTTSTVREWKRRDWGPGGFEFHWWCTDAPDAFVGTRTVMDELREELIEMIGASVYELLVIEVAAWRRRGTPVAHPAVRR